MGAPQPRMGLAGGVRRARGTRSASAGSCGATSSSARRDRVRGDRPRGPDPEGQPRFQHLSGRPRRRVADRGLREELVRRSGVEPGRIVVEISESALTGAPDDYIERVTVLRALGVKIALDDFGTASTSIAQLRRCRSTRSSSTAPSSRGSVRRPRTRRSRRECCRSPARSAWRWSPRGSRPTSTSPTSSRSATGSGRGTASPRRPPRRTSRRDRPRAARLREVPSKRYGRSRESFRRALLAGTRSTRRRSSMRRSVPGSGR